MRLTTTLLAALLTTLLASACSQEPSPAQQPAKPAVQEPQPATAKSVEMAQQEIKTAAAKAESEVKQEARTVVAEATSPPPPPAPKAPEVVIYPASMGQVTFSHGTHAARSACGKCHTTDPPQKIAIDKESAHALCKGCHQVSGGNAPTACTGCHKKG